MKLRTLFLFALLPLAALGAILPSDRTIDWSTAGVVGGIPSRTTVSQTVDVAYGNDSTDARAHIQSKLNATASGGVCFIPGGTYRVNGNLVVPSNITVRGAGIDVTIIKQIGATGDNGTFCFGTFGGQMPYYPSTYSVTVSSGATAASTSMVLSSAAGISTGDRVCVTMINDGTTVINNSALNGTAPYIDGWGSSTGGAGSYTGGTRSRGQMVRITGISSNTVTFTPALFTNYSGGTPWVTKMVAQGPSNSGVEDLTIYATNTGSRRNIIFDGAYNCWAYNVKGDFTDGDHAIFDWSLNCEVRHSYFKEAFVHSAGGYDAMVCLRAKATQNLIIDNVMERLHISILTEWGAAGNVIAYNYTFGEYDDSEASGNRAMQMGISGNHGLHPQFNLFEGNITPHLLADSFFSTSSHGVFLRNWVTGVAQSRTPYSTRSGSPGAPYNLTQARRAVDLWDGQTSYSVIGNILGTTATTGSDVVAVLTHPSARSYTDLILDCRGFISTADDGSLTTSLPAPSSTLLSHGNHNAKTGTQSWDAGIADHDIPLSYYFTTEQRAAFLRGLSGFDPANPSAASIDDIPAGYRVLNGVDPTGGSDTTPPTPNPSTIASVTVTGPTSITVVASTATDGASPPVQHRHAINGSYQEWQSSATYAFTGLTAATSYDFKVQSRDAAGNVTTESSVSSATTSSNPPGPERSRAGQRQSRGGPFRR